jgi:cytochrome c551/c552
MDLGKESAMRRIAALMIFAAVTAALGACGSKNESTTTETGSPPASAPTATTPPATTDTAVTATTAVTPAPTGKSKYDDGPRADATPVNAAMAAEGKTLFTNKGCVTCHAIGKKVIGPDLKGVTSRRTAQWMEQQILHPEVMTKEDPIAHALLEQYKVPMTNQGLTPEQAKAVIEYLKQAD